MEGYARTEGRAREICGEVCGEPPAGKQPKAGSRCRIASGVNERRTNPRNTAGNRTRQTAEYRGEQNKIITIKRKEKRKWQRSQWCQGLRPYRDAWGTDGAFTNAKSQWHLPLAFLRMLQMIGVDVHPLGVLDLLYKRIFSLKKIVVCTKVLLFLNVQIFYCFIVP